jgi:probable O-glycosylation ligase (exosortase A-associated)
MKGLVFTYLLTYGGGLVAVFHPFVGLLIYICFAILRPESLWHWAVPPGNYSRIVAIALLAGWALKGFGKWQLGRATGVLLALLAYAAWSVVSALQAGDQTLAWGYVEELAKIVLPFLVGMTTIDSISKLKQLAWVIVLSQGYVAYEMNLAYLGGFNLIAETGFGGMDNNCVAITLVTCIGLAFFLGLSAERWWQKGVALLCALFMVHGVFLSFSRGGMLALIITSGVMFLLIPKTRNHYIIFAAGLLVGIRLAGPEVIERFMSSFADAKQRDASAESRIKLWQDALDCASKHPLFGVGPRNWRVVVTQYGWPKDKEAHTLWLQLAAELGFPGLLVLLLFYGLCVGRLWKYTKERTPVSDPWIRAFARMVIASIIGFVISAQFVSLVGLETPYYVVLLGAGTLHLASRRSEVNIEADEQAEETELDDYDPHPIPAIR